jgi:peptidyl-prolyl cis-trans isomerase A (cyclophilin A)
MVEKFFLMFLFISILVPAACSEAADDGADAGSGAGDTDTDSDADADTDTESDSDADAGADAGPEEAITDRVAFTTTMGDFVIGLYGDAMPITVANFLAYVDEGFYDGLIFHRVIADFMIQGGGYDEELTAKDTNDPIVLEIAEGISHQPGVIGMARTPAPNSATSQFFINVADNSDLDGDYAAFGITESGYDVVESISLVATGTVGSFANLPVEPVIIESVVRINDK